MTQTTDILALGEQELTALVQDLGESAYRGRQIVEWLYGKRVGSFDEMTNVPASLREVLADRFRLGRPSLGTRQESADGTRKYVWRLADGRAVESVGIPSDERLTVCFSTQVGCAMGCAFCATGQGGLERSLTPGEMALQVALVADDFGIRASNAVAMGQGEPFAAYEATLAGLRLMNSGSGLSIGARHLTVSTCGIVPGIDRLSGEPEQFTLAVSLHSAVQETRDRLMPAVSAYPLERLRAALAGYATRSGRRPTLEYALMEGVNDSDAESDALVRYCRELLCHVNLIPANPVPDTAFERAPDRTVERFRARLEDAGVQVSVRAERGADIDAACGQLRLRSVDGPGTGHVAP
jgi:23S rRNA (adenine2503-C2)-methyltransferase